MLEKLRGQLQELGLSHNEARVLLAILQLGSVSGPDLARVSGVPRTSVYPVLDSLRAKHLAEPLSGRSALWVTPGPEEVLNRLYAAQEERLRVLAGTVELARKTLSRVLPDGPPLSLPQVHLIHGAAQLKRSYERLLEEASSEVLTFSRPPYSWAPGNPNPMVLRSLSRIETGRAMYQAADFNSSEAQALRLENEAYMKAGLRVRVVDHLPLKLVIFDRRVALVGLLGMDLPEPGYPSHLLVEDAGYADVMAAAFEYFWAQGRPIPATTHTHM